MIDIKILLPELKKLVTELSEDLLARIKNDLGIDAGLREAYAQIEKGGRTGDPYEVWLEDYLDQVAVAWVLSCVFVRFMEDNNLIDQSWLAGQGERRQKAEDSHELYFRENPRKSDRDYFQHVFREVGKIPACRDLFAEGKTPLWAVGPSGDAAMKLLSYWREMDSESGKLKRTFEVENTDSRFLGDLYQDLSEKARKKFALLQTPVFVEEFILDRTLDPAVAEFGLKDVRMIDPTCGSGHFLLGAFTRLFKLRSKPENTTGSLEKDVQLALDGVWGTDINPFAVTIARFRLILVATQACGKMKLKDAHGWTVHIAAGDSLLMGTRFAQDQEGDKKQLYFETEEEGSWAPEIYACEEPLAIKEILGQQYHVVVGNPPYIIVRDRVLNKAYRELYPTCHQKYSLAVPFMERFFDLAITGKGYVGKITANSFMKREFGKKLIEDFFPKRDLTHVIDTSGAYIPGHGTPTVVLLGRSRAPMVATVRAVLGIKGEPSTPDDPSLGQVWQSIISHIDHTNRQDNFTSVNDTPRDAFEKHPWSIGGGGATDVLEKVESNSGYQLSKLVESIGITAFTLEDEVYIVPRSFISRIRIESLHVREMQVGEMIRDWSSQECEPAIFPYDQSRFVPMNEDYSTNSLRYLWNYRTNLANSKMFGSKTKVDSGLNWYEYGRLTHAKLRTALSITFAFVASHNHFVLDRGGKVFNRSAPIIKLPQDASEYDHLALLGLLNSSTACFWMKQVSQQKQMTGGDGVRVSTRAAVPYEFAGTQLQKLPIPASFDRGSLRDLIQNAAARIDVLVRETSELTSDKAIQIGLDGGAAKIGQVYKRFLARRTEIRAEMVFLQEEIDFISYLMFGIIDESSLIGLEWEWSNIALDAGQRPFEILQQRNIDGFAVPKEVPAEWPSDLQQLWNRRMDAIKNSPDLRLIEDDHYKRRWRGRQGLFNHTENQDELKVATRQWLLDRLETQLFWPDPAMQEPRLQSVAKLSDKVGSDPHFMQVAAIYRGRDDFDVAALIAELVIPESVPSLPVLRYKSTGLRKRELWEKTWELQRKADSEDNVGDIKVPPKYSSTDFQKSDFWRLRGKLDVPKERWISYPYCETEGDPSLVVGWAGWNHLQQGTAIVAYYDARKNEGWTAERLKPLLTALDQLLPWIHQWHPEIDPEYNESAGTSFQTLLDAETQELGLTMEDIRNWTPPAKKKAVADKQPRKARITRKKKMEAEAEE